MRIFLECPLDFEMILQNFVWLVKFVLKIGLSFIWLVKGFFKYKLFRHSKFTREKLRLFLKEAVG